MTQQVKHIVYMALGYLFLLIGVIGLLLPVMPTVPFMIGAAYFFSRSSPRLHHWIITRPHFGPAVVAWEQHRAIAPRTKLVAIGLILMSGMVTTAFMNFPWWLGAAYWAVLLGVSAYLGSRPSGPS